MHKRIAALIEKHAHCNMLVKTELQVGMPLSVKLFEEVQALEK